jgi:hypothetical protein
MIINYPEIGVCGLSCGLCPTYHTKTKSRCFGCKSEVRMAVGCPFITCAIKRKGIEFCWECEENERCEKWKKHREAGKRFDSFKCYQKLEDNIVFIQKNGVEEFQSVQKIREELLQEMLKNFNEGRSKSYFCIAATVLEIEELEKAVNEATAQSKESGIREKSKILHSLLSEIAVRKNLLLKLRK